MDRIDNNTFRSLLNEATNILNKKNQNLEYVSLEEAVQNGILTEEEATQINQTIFENTVLIPNIEKLVEDIENYTGEELTEEQLNELLGGISALTGAALGGLGRLGARAMGATARGVKKIASGVGKGVGKVANIYAKGEKARGEAKAETAGKVLSAPTARGKLGAIISGQGSGVGSAFRAGVDHGPSVEREETLKAARSGDASAADKLKKKLKAKGLSGKVQIKMKDGKYHVTDSSGGEHMVDHYVFSKEDGKLILEQIQ